MREQTYEEPIEFGSGAGFSYEIFVDGTKIEWFWNVEVSHAGYKGWPTHPAPYGWRREIAEDINYRMLYARKTNPHDFYPSEVLY